MEAASPLRTSLELSSLRTMAIPLDHERLLEEAAVTQIFKISAIFDTFLTLRMK
jgi:hypothetical protein